MNFLILLVMCLSLSACSKVQYLNEALRLKAYSDDADARAAIIADQQAKVAELLVRISAGDMLADLATKADLQAQLGDPILAEPLPDGTERWLYRDPVRYFNVPKVYFFVDPAGRVVHWTSTVHR